MTDDKFKALVSLIEAISDEIYWRNTNSNVCDDNRLTEVINKIKSILVEEDYPGFDYGDY